jgi:hypothetical protein
LPFLPLLKKPPAQIGCNDDDDKKDGHDGTGKEEKKLPLQMVQESVVRKESTTIAKGTGKPKAASSDISEPNVSFLCLLFSFFVHFRI